jgi:hypothetical protein
VEPLVPEQDEQTSNFAVPTAETPVPDVGFVDIRRSVTTFDDLVPEMQSYVVENFAALSPEAINVLNTVDAVDNRQVFEEILELNQLRDDISEQFRSTPTLDSVNQQREIQRSRVRARISELFPQLGDEDELEELTETITSVLEQQRFKSNPLSALYDQDDMSGSTFEELESFTNVGDAFESAEFDKVDASVNDFNYNNLFNGEINESPGSLVVKTAIDTALGLGKGAKTGVLEGLAFLTESPAMLADFSNLLISAEGDLLRAYVDDTQSQFTPIAEDPILGPVSQQFQDARKLVINKVRSAFRGNDIAQYLRGMVNADDEYTGDFLGPIRDGNLREVNKQISFLAGRMFGEVAGTAGVGLPFKYFGVAYPRLAPTLGFIAAERRQQELLAEGVDKDTATVNAMTYGIVNAVLSEKIVIDKFKNITRLVSKDFGINSGREFALNVVKNLSKDFAADGTMMATAEGLLTATDYLTGVTDNLDDAADRITGGFILGGAMSLLAGPPTRYMGFKARTRRAQEHYDHTLGLTEIYDNIRSMDNPRMRDAAGVLLKDSSALPDTFFVDANNINNTLNMTDAQFLERSGINPEVLQAAKDANQGVSVATEVIIDAMSDNLDGRLDMSYLRAGPDGPTARESAAYIDAVDAFYNGVLRREIKVGTLYDNLVARIGLKEAPLTSPNSLAQSALAYAKAIYNGSFGRAQRVFGRRDVAPESTQPDRGVRVEFREAEIPDVPIPAETLRLLPASLDEPGLAQRQVFPDKVVDTLVTNESARINLDKEYNSFLDKYRITDESQIIANETIMGIDQPTFDAFRMQKDVYENIVTDPGLADAADILFGRRVNEAGQPFKIDYDSFKALYGSERAKFLSRGLGKTLFSKSKKEGEQGLLLQDALVELGMTPQVFEEMLSDTDIRAMVREGSVENFAVKESERVTKSVVKHVDTYNKMASTDKDPLISAYERWLKDESANEAIDKHLHPEYENVRAKEIQRLETQLPKEFRRQTSPLLKGGRINKVTKDAIAREIMNYDYKYVQKNAFLRDALSLERYYDTQSASMVRFGNMEKAYEFKAMAAKMHEYAKAQYQAIRLVKKIDKMRDAITKTDVAELNQAGYDMDYVHGARYVMRQAGVSAGDYGASAHLEVLKRQDPVKYETLVDRMDKFVPSVREGMTLEQYANFVSEINDIVEAGRGEARNYMVGDKTVDQARGDIFDALIERENTTLDARTKGKFSANARAIYVSKLKDALDRGESLDNMDLRAMQIDANTMAKDFLDLGRPSLLNYPQVTNIVQGFYIAGDFLNSLNIPELSRAWDMVRESNSSLINSINSPDGHLNFISQSITPLINKNASTLAFRGRKQLGPIKVTANQLNAFVLHLGNESNALRLAVRNFGTNLEGLKGIVKEAIDNGTLTREHFELAQRLGQRFDKKFNELQPHTKKTFGRFAKPIKTEFVLSDIVPDEWIRDGWYAPLKSETMNVADRIYQFKDSQDGVDQVLKDYSQNGFLQDLKDLFDDNPVEIGAELNRTKLDGPKLNLDFGAYVNSLLQIDKVIHTRDAAVAINSILRDPNIVKMIDNVSPGVMENSILPALKAFNDQSLQSGAIGDIRLESARKASDSFTNVVTGAAGKMQIAFNLTTPFLNISESGKVADLMKYEGFTGRQNRALNLINFAGRFAHLALHREQVEFLQRTMPYLQARQQNRMVETMRALDVATRQTALMRKMPWMPSRSVEQLNAFMLSISRVADHWTQGIVDATAASMFLDGYLDRGLPQHEAIRLTERAIEQTMPGYFSHELYALSQSNMGRVFFQYMQWAMKSNNYFAGRRRQNRYEAAQQSDDGGAWAGMLLPFTNLGIFGGLYFFTMMAPSAMEELIRGQLSGRDNLDQLQSDFESDALLTTARMVGQMSASPLDRLPVIGGTLKRSGYQIVSKALGDPETHSGYFNELYKAGSLASEQDLVNLPIMAVGKTIKDAGVGMYTYGTVGEYQRVYEAFGSDYFRTVDPGTAASNLMALMALTPLPVPAGPAPRNSAKFLFNLNAGQDNWSDSGMLLDLLRGKGENLRNPPKRKNRRRRRRE